MEHRSNVTLSCCANSFCERCLEHWNNKYSATCPTCRKTLRDFDREQLAWVNIEAPFSRHQIVRMVMVFIQRAPTC
jgi:hypothetical protein